MEMLFSFTWKSDILNIFLCSKCRNSTWIKTSFSFEWKWPILNGFIWLESSIFIRMKKRFLMMKESQTWNFFKKKGQENRPCLQDRQWCVWFFFPEKWRTFCNISWMKLRAQTYQFGCRIHIINLHWISWAISMFTVMILTHRHIQWFCDRSGVQRLYTWASPN